MTQYRNAPGPYFGEFGGRFVPESLIAALDELDREWTAGKNDPEFWGEFQRLLRDYAGRPSLLTEAPTFAESAGGARILLKREDLNHTGSHKINNVLGQALLTKRLGKTRIIAETGAGPHPFPALVRDTQQVISIEARQQCLDLTGALPDAVVACVGGGSNAIGMFEAFLDDESVKLYGIEAAGDGEDTPSTAATIGTGRTGVLHGAKTLLMQDEDGQTIESHSISAGLDYPGVGPEHSWLARSGRVTYSGATDTEAMEAMRLLSRTEGIIPAIESAHALAGALKIGTELGPDATIIVSLSGRGDKDMETAMNYFELGDASRVIGGDK